MPRRPDRDLLLLWLAIAAGLALFAVVVTALADRALSAPPSSILGPVRAVEKQGSGPLLGEGVSDRPNVGGGSPSWWGTRLPRVRAPDA